MAKQASVFARIDPLVKEQAETVLNQLGISMATAMEIYLRQIAMQRKIPFEMALPNDRPVAYGALSDMEFNASMDKAMKQYANGECTSVDEFEADLLKEFGV